MCGIAGIYNTRQKQYPHLSEHLRAMNQLQAHRGPDGDNIWTHSSGFLGFGHRRLAIIDLVTGAQPLTDAAGNTICYNGEIYNYIELREQLKSSYSFRTTSDTEVILAAYQKWGNDCVSHLRGMFSFAIWDESQGQLFCARDRFGIKPFYYALVNENFYFASEAKALLPFLPSVETDLDGLKDYLVFQLCLGDKTLFRHIKQLLPAHAMVIKGSNLTVSKYWEVNFALDWHHTQRYFHDRLRDLFEDSVQYHLRSDVPVGAYLSGGVDSSLIATLAGKYCSQGEFEVFHGKFSDGRSYDESEFAREVAAVNGYKLHELDIKSDDFIANIHKVIYHLDYPTAGPGSFPQYMVSRLASERRKVVLGGQGGDEVFGGYVRYLLAYFEQCIKGAIDDSLYSGNFIVTYESIIPNLRALKGYEPLMQEFWSEGLFESRDKRYFRLINRANMLRSEINWDILESYSAFEDFKKIFWSDNVGAESYFDSMTHFDFKTLLPSLLHVEDRMSMAHGLESRVPILDQPLIEFAATIPSNVKFENGDLKHLLKTTFAQVLPEKIINRKEKMGFPVPLNDWMKGDLSGFTSDIFSSKKARQREYLNPKFDIGSLISTETKFSRKLWGLLSLELWQQEFHDKADHYRKMANSNG
jgi:asparagine synthase (glutamine-hydrolysing)